MLPASFQASMKNFSSNVHIIMLDLLGCNCMTLDQLPIPSSGEDCHTVTPFSISNVDLPCLNLYVDFDGFPILAAVIPQSSFLIFSTLNKNRCFETTKRMQFFHPDFWNQLIYDTLAKSHWKYG